MCVRACVCVLVVKHTYVAIPTPPESTARGERCRPAACSLCHTDKTAPSTPHTPHTDLHIHMDNSIQHIYSGLLQA